ncbi:hypothetical protein JMN32_22825 [Fulvivirga sp. 29W222]|uniref:Condensation domain-containing protein n=1 Tax=Fulvivirga marina TaxID=2494733 RepID=A0A937KE44_9BACT|nr:condensation domain-containing protein [Fulvivirga marina]MBL6449164.1 hypothetical protein [Fulvivirga marina]
MSVLELILELKNANLKIRVGENNKLKIFAPHGKISDELKKKISERKEELVKYLNETYYGTVKEAHNIRKAPSLPYYEVSHAQKRLWIIDQFEKEERALNFVPNAHTIKGHLDIEAFSKAWDTLAERHEVLRTIFLNIDGTPMQKVLPSLPGPLVEYIDLSNTDDADDRAEALSEEENNTPFDLEKGPLIRVKLIKVREEEYLLLFTLHHIIADGWSNMVLQNELVTLYDAYSKKEDNPFEPLKIQYKDFVYWQKEKRLASEEKYWLDKLAGDLNFIELPYDYDMEEESYHGKSIFHTIDEETTAQLKKIASQANRSLSHLVFTVFNVFLHEISDQEDLLVGMAVANRNHLELEKLIGFFINTLVIKSTITDEMDFKEIFDHVSANLIEAHEHQDYPFDLLVEKLNPERVSKKQPLFNVMYSYQSFNDVNLNLDRNKKNVLSLTDIIDDHALATEATHQAVNKAYFDLTNRVVDQGETILLELEYNADLFEQETIESLFEIYEDAFITAAQLDNN